MGDARGKFECGVLRILRQLLNELYVLKIILLCKIL